MITTGKVLKTGPSVDQPQYLATLLLAISFFTGTPQSFAQQAQQPGPTTEAEALGLDPMAPPPPLPAAPAPDTDTEKALQPLLPSPSEAAAPTPPVANEIPAVAPKASNPALTAAEEATVNSPDAYEEQLKKKREVLTTPNWSFNILVEPRSFRMTDWRAAPTDREVANPKFFGMALQGERFIFKKFGMTSVGAELGLYGVGGDDDFRRTMPALLTAGGSLTYQFNYFTGQWVVPFIQGSLSSARYNYTFNNAIISGFKLLPRADFGLMLYLNFLDRDSAGDMFGNYGILRTYLVASVTMTDDRTPQKHINLQGQTLRVGLRFEF